MDLLLQASAFVPAYKYTWPGHHLAYGPGNFTALPHTFNLSILADVSADERYRVEKAEKREAARQNYLDYIEAPVEKRHIEALDKSGRYPEVTLSHLQTYAQNLHRQRRQPGELDRRYQTLVAATRTQDGTTNGTVIVLGRCS